MLAATANSTSLHFGLNHMCHKHNVLFTMEHVEAVTRSLAAATSGATPGDSRNKTSGTGRRVRGNRPSLSSPRSPCR